MSLFQSADGPALRRIKLEAVKLHVSGLDRDVLLNTELEELIEFYVQTHHVDVPTLRFDQAEMAGPQVINMMPRDYGSDRLVTGTLTKIEVPFNGDAAVLQMRGNTESNAPPEGYVHNDRLSLDVQLPGEFREVEFKRIYQRWRENVELHMSWQVALWAGLDDDLRRVARRELEARRELVTRTDEAAARTAATLGFKLKVRPGDPVSFNAPAVRQKVVAKLPAPTSQQLDPTLDTALYRDIVRVLSNAGQSIERSASAIRQHDEEILRDILLIPLNSHFENAASGEAFSKGGKTDILIHHADGVVFVAECKIWEGPKTFSDAMTQLFGYLTWRDTKAAVIMFSRRQGFTAVQEKLRSEAKGHPGFVSGPRTVDRASSEFTFRRPDDNQKHVTITMMAFDLGAD